MIFWRGRLTSHNMPRLQMVPRDLNIGETGVWHVWRLDSGQNLQPKKCCCSPCFFLPNYKKRSCFCSKQKVGDSRFARWESWIIWAKWVEVEKISCLGSSTVPKNQWEKRPGSSHNWLVVWNTFSHFYPYFPGKMIQFDEHMFQMGWFNHQLDNHGWVKNGFIQ